MFRLLMYFLFLPFWLIWWFIKLVFFFMLQLEVFWEVSMLVEQLEDEEDGKTSSFLFRVEGLLDLVVFFYVNENYN